MDYTRKEIRTEVRDIISDPSKQLINDDSLNRAIDRAVRKFVELTECNRNVLIVNFPDALTDPTIEFNMLGDETELTLTDAEGWNLYTVPKCLILEYVDRWILTTDGYFIEMEPVGTNQIDVMALLYGNHTVPQQFNLFDVNKFRLMPDLQDATYPFDLTIVHRMEETPLIYDSDYPSADGTGVQTAGATLDDLTGDISGYTGTISALFEVKVTSAGPTDIVQWRKNGGAWSADANITGNPQTMSDGVTYEFAATTGHALGETWAIFTADKSLPTIPRRYLQVVVYLTVKEIAPGYKIRDRQLSEDYGIEAAPYIVRAKKFAGKLLKRKATRMANRYKPAGWETNS